MSNKKNFYFWLKRLPFMIFVFLIMGIVLDLVWGLNILISAKPITQKIAFLIVLSAAAIGIEYLIEKFSLAEKINAMDTPSLPFHKRWPVFLLLIGVGFVMLCIITIVYQFILG